MANKQLNTTLETFAWLIFEEVERYVNEHLEEYETWVQERTTACKQEGDDKTQGSNIQPSKSA